MADYNYRKKRIVIIKEFLTLSDFLGQIRYYSNQDSGDKAPTKLPRAQCGPGAWGLAPIELDFAKAITEYN